MVGRSVSAVVGSVISRTVATARRLRQLQQHRQRMSLSSVPSTGERDVGIVSVETSDVTDRCAAGSLQPDGLLGNVRSWEFKDGFTPISVVGRLKESFSFWATTVKASRFVLGIIEHGYRVPFISEPPPFFAPNNLSARCNSDFVAAAVNELLAKGIVTEVDTQPFCCNPLTVAQGKKLRLVLDLRHVNQYVLHQGFKYETWNEAIQVVSKDSYFVKFDFTSGFHHVSIFPDHCKYFGFSCPFSGSKPRFFEFKQLPFGLSSACYVFTKITRQLVKFWRSQGINNFIYIDDGLVIAKSIWEAQNLRDVIRSDLLKSGFVVNEEKSMWIPQTIVTWLGFIADSHTLRLYVPECKIDRLVELAESLLEHNSRCTVRRLASFCGMVIATLPAVGPLARLMSRSSALVCAQMAPRWDAVVMLNTSARDELHFWVENIRQLNGYSFAKPADCTAVCFSDASATGYGGYTVSHGRSVTRGSWSRTEAKNSSTWRELAAVYRTLMSFQGQLTGHRIHWYTDNANVPRIIANGSVKPDIQSLAVQLLHVCRKNGIQLHASWLSRANNRIADQLSRWEDRDDWSIQRFWFRFLDRIWGPHTVDRFAADYNTQLPNFNSEFWCNGTQAVDCFTQDWSHDNNWLCPPVRLVLRVIAHAERQRASGTLIVPFWESAVYWPILFPGGLQGPATFITDLRVLAAGFVPSRAAHACIFVHNPKFYTLAIRLSWR